jgi:hypothetical protein
MEYTPREEHAVYRGPGAVIQYVQRWLEAWDTFVGEAGEVEGVPPSHLGERLARVPVGDATSRDGQRKPNVPHRAL